MKRMALGNRRSQATEMVLKPGDSEGDPLIEHGDRHEIDNTSRGLLRTLNFYVPPAYTKGGDELPRAKPS